MEQACEVRSGVVRARSLLVLLVLGVCGCSTLRSTPGALLEEMPRVRKREACVILFRYADDTFGWLPRYPDIVIDGTAIEKLRAGDCVIHYVKPGTLKIEATGPFYRWPFQSYTTTRELKGGETLVLRLAKRKKAVDGAEGEGEESGEDEDEERQYKSVTYFREYWELNPYVLAELRQLNIFKR